MSTSPISDLTIDLDALAHNWMLFRSRLSPDVDCGAVIKANAYGLGVKPVLRRLLREGCNTFFVANLREALTVKDALAEYFEGPLKQVVVVLSGCAPGEELAFVEHRLRPVLVSVEMLERWLQALRRAGLRTGAAPAILKLDTGMSRLGLQPDQLETLLKSPEKLKHAGIDTLMSHLACADESDGNFSAMQLRRFSQGLDLLRKHLPMMKGSLANSAGVLLGADYHFDGVRPGIGLYGGSPQSGVAKFGRPVAHLRLPVIQTRFLPEGGSVGYGATCHFESATRLAIIAGGYADGIFRSLSNRARCWVDNPSGGGWYVPVCGRVSMDSFIVDISKIPPSVVHEGLRIELLGEHITVDELASAAGTISYEVLTSLGDRYRRSYQGACSE